MRYSPSLSISDNAKQNNCSEAAVRKYIRIRGIDRRYEKKVGLVNEIRKVLQKNPSAKLSDIAQITHHSLNTIKLYYKAAIGEAEVSRSSTKKVAKTDIRQYRDYYATHPSAVRDILTKEKFSKWVLEPCCGGGYMAEEIKKAGYKVSAYDIVNRGYGKQADFLNTDWEQGKWDIITNPPFKSVTLFIRKAIEICKEKVAILLPLRYLTSQERYDFYKEYPPARVYAYTNRICIAKNGRFDKYQKGQSAVIYAWFIWEKGYRGDTILKWITNK